MKRTIYDAEECRAGNCPKFVYDDEKQVVSLIDREGNEATMTPAEFNSFLSKVKSGELVAV